MPHPKFDNLLKRPTELKKTLYVLLQRIQVNSEVNRYIRGDLQSPTGAASTPMGWDSHPPGLRICLPTQKLSELCCLGVFMGVSLCRHDSLNHWSLVMSLNLQVLPPP